HVPDAAALALVDVDRVLAPGPEVGIGPAGQGLEGPVVEVVLDLPLELGRLRGGHETPCCRGRGFLVVLIVPRAPAARQSRDSQDLRYNPAKSAGSRQVSVTVPDAFTWPLIRISMRYVPAGRPTSRPSRPMHRYWPDFSGIVPSTTPSSLTRRA